MEHSSAVIRTMVMEAKNTEDGPEIEKEIKKEIIAIKDAMYSYLQHSKSSKIPPTKFEVEHNIGIFQDKENARKNFVDALKYVKAEVFNGDFPYDMNWQIIKIKSNKYNRFEVETLVYEIEFIDREPEQEEGAAPKNIA